MQIRCSECGSDEWKLASFIHNSGTGSIHLSSTGESHVRRGMGSERAQTTGESTGDFKSKLAQKAAPPGVEPNPGVFKSYEEFAKSNNIKYWVFGGVIAASVFNENSTWTQRAVLIVVLFFGMLVIGVLGSKESYQVAKEKHDLAVAKYDKSVLAFEAWERTRVCMRCGTFYESSPGDA